MKSYRFIPMALIGLFILGLDQFTKYLVVRFMEEGESIPVLGEYLELTSHRNSGAAWGMFQGQMIFFYVVTLIVLAILVYVYIKEAKGNFLLQLAIVMLIAGSLGNFIDRILFQEVVDFIDVLIVFYDFPIFNVADSALTVGVILMLLEFFFIGKGDKDAGNYSK
ncbi:signal peptidase II [Salinicoccus bachuensis]|uniref:Lipoprotein signal peptidase n=1 Tax=Salinicoccus bachuensis TaxID=3136731 RepID=A0ABZ3CMB5_9STAP